MAETPKAIGTREVLAKNTLLNFAVQAVMIPLAVVSIPILIRRLGSDTFGILSMIWVFVGYFALLDFGMGKTVTKYVAESLAKGERKKAWRIVWVSMFVSLLIGVVLMTLVGGFAGFLSHKLFTGKSINYPEVRAGLLIAAGTLPFVLGQGILRAQLMAIQRFDVANLVQASFGVAQWVGAIVLVELGFGLIGILFYTLILRMMSVGVLLFVVHRTSEGFLDEFILGDLGILKGLIGYSSWIALMQMVSPVLIYADRFFLSSFVSTTKATFLIVPYEMVSRFQIIPMALTTTLFPAFTERHTLEGMRESMETLYRRSIKYIFLVMLPLTLICLVFAHDILRIWVGAEFASQSSLAFQVFAVGFLMNAVAFIPSVTLQAVGRPDRVAKLQLAELPFYLACCIFAIPAFGVNGAAIGNAARMGVDMALLLFLARRELGKSYSRLDFRSISRMAVPALFLCGGAFIIDLVPGGLVFKIVGILCLLIAYLGVVYYFTFDNSERDFLGSSVSRIMTLAAGRLPNGN
ncbi:MAG: flippase [Bacteroidetes bacterium]|nr:flippase [Bacteroidota bacterium]